jgi:hypothetical protein
MTLRTPVLGLTALVLAACSSGGALEVTSSAIGPEGGTVTSVDGIVTLDIPPGALLTTEEITLDVHGAEDWFDAASDVYDLSPDGLVFEAPVTVTFRVPDVAEDQELVVANLDEELPVILEGSSWDAETGEVTALLEHFSRYAAFRRPRRARHGGSDGAACLRRCVSEGGDEGTCRRACTRAQRERCASACREAAAARGEACIRRGGEPRRCRAAAEEAARTCTALRCADDVTRRAAVCRRSCRDAASERVERCLRRGGSVRECRAGGEEALRMCLAERCAPAVCRTACRDAASERVERCLRRGGSVRECRAGGEEALRMCLAERCAEPDEEPPCLDACRRAAAERRGHCIRRGGSEYECAGVAERTLRACVAERCEGRR